MKKIIISILLLTGLCSFACDIQCPENKDITSSTSRFFSTVTGQRKLSEIIGEKLIKKAIKQNITSGKIKTDIKSFSTRDLKVGKFESIELTGKDISVQDIYISYIHAKTLCDYNYIGQDKNGNVTIKDDIPFAVEIILTEDNLNKTMQSDNYKRLINDINNMVSMFNAFQINSTSVKIKNNKIYYIAQYYIPFIRQPKHIVIVSDLKVADGMMELENSKVIGNSISFDINKLSKIINYINPLDFSLNMQENRDTKINIQNVKIEEGKIIADGILTVLKDKE